jgi:WD40 repeat protein
MSYFTRRFVILIGLIILLAMCSSGQWNRNGDLRVGVGNRFTAMSAHAEKPFPAPDFVLKDAPHKEPRSGVQVGPGGQITIMSGVGTPTVINGLSFSADGNLLAAGKDFGRVVVWDVQRHTFLRAVETGQGIVWAVALSPDGKTLATGGSDDDFSVKVWDVSTGKLLKILKENKNSIQCLVFDPMGKWLAVADNSGKALVFDVSTWSVVLRLTDTHVARFSQDGSALVTADQKEFSMWSVGKWIKTQAIPRWQGFPTLVAVHPATDRFAVYQAWGVHLVRFSTGTPIEGLADILPKTSTGNPRFMEFSSDGLLLFGSVKDRLWVWDTKTNEVCASQVMYSSGDALSTDNHWLAGAKDDSVLSKERTDGVWVWDTSHLLATCGMTSSSRK